MSKAFECPESFKRVCRQGGRLEVGGPIDVVWGYSQGVVAANNTFDGKEIHSYLMGIKVCTAMPMIVARCASGAWKAHHARVYR